MISCKLLTITKVDLSQIIEYIVQHIENSAEGSKMFFPFRSTPRKHWQPQGSRRARAVTRTARAVCEAVSGGRCPCVHKNRALELEHALLLSSTRQEPSAHGSVTSSALACVRRSSCSNDAFFSRNDFPFHRTRRRSVYLYDNTHLSE